MDNTFPVTIRAGMTTEVEVVGDSIGLTVKLLANCAGTTISLTAVDNGDYTYTFTFPAGTAYTAGLYTFVVFTESGTVGAPVREQQFTGRFRMLPSLASGDPRSQAQIILDAINAVIAGRASAKQRSVTVGDKSVAYLSMSELLEARAFYTELVDEELSEQDGINRQTYYAEFTRT